MSYSVDSESAVAAQSGPAARDGREVLVQVKNVSKKFCRDLKKSLWYGVCDIATELNPLRRLERGSSLAQGGLREGEFWANQDVSFELRRGECLGLIGRNGAGKTTLLKMLNGLIKPDSGSIEMRGRVGALIALGAGFNPILSGRENIYVNGSVLGLTNREIDAKIDEIIDFAEIRESIDAPVQSYSSGMQVRLGFAVATALEPDVLILDEVLAVGDAAFRAKCYRRIVSLRKRAAVIFVTHSMEQVARICDTVLLLSKGTVNYHGGVAGGVEEYDRINEVGLEQDPAFLSLATPILDFKLENPPSEVKGNTPLTLALRINSSRELADFRIRILIFNLSGALVAEIDQRARDYSRVVREGGNHFLVTIGGLPLRSGRYNVGFNVIDSFGDLVVWSYKQYYFSVVGGGSGMLADCQLPIESWVETPQGARSSGS